MIPAGRSSPQRPNAAAPIGSIMAGRHRSSSQSIFQITPTPRHIPRGRPANLLRSKRGNQHVIDQDRLHRDRAVSSHSRRRHRPTSARPARRNSDSSSRRNRSLATVQSASRVVQRRSPPPAEWIEAEPIVDADSSSWCRSGPRCSGQIDIPLRGTGADPARPLGTIFAFRISSNLAGIPSGCFLTRRANG